MKSVYLGPGSHEWSNMKTANHFKNVRHRLCHDGWADQTFAAQLSGTFPPAYVSLDVVVGATLHFFFLQLVSLCVQTSVTDPQPSYTLPFFSLLLSMSLFIYLLWKC